MAENYFYSSLSAQEIEDTLTGAVVFNSGQTLSTSQKARARQNIGAGAENTGFRILGYFDTLEDLQEYLQVPPQAGDAYGIGTAVPYDIYVWDAANNEWVDNGTLDIAEFIDDSETSSILTWSSQKIDADKQDKIVADGVLKGGGNGSVTAATKGTDYGALAFTVTLEAASWSSNVQTVSNANFLASGFAYMVAPASSSFAAYGEASIYADDVTTDGVMTFHCDSAPSVDLTVNIVRMVSA